MARFVVDVVEQILMIAQEADCLKLGNVSLDGTNIKANANK
ncbi:hypothetical protein ACTL6P_20760 [Endozoicomonas acroporae]|nr:hypothetical protein [Endozoicomonas acroporae]